MRSRTKTLFKSNILKLTKYSSPKTGKIHYTVELVDWHYGSMWRKSVELDDIRKLFDPGKNRGSLHGIKWKFKNRKEAEQLIMTAIIKWG